MKEDVKRRSQKGNLENKLLVEFTEKMVNKKGLDDEERFRAKEEENCRVNSVFSKKN